MSSESAPPTSVGPAIKATKLSSLLLFLFSDWQIYSLPILASRELEYTDLTRRHPEFIGEVHVGDMVWLNRLPIPVGGGGGNFLVQMISTCLPSRTGRVGVGVGALWGNVGGTKSNDRLKSMVIYTCSYSPGL